MEGTCSNGMLYNTVGVIDRLDPVPYDTMDCDKFANTSRTISTK